ncbi:MAG: hypothetical protein AAGJ31_12640 [Verrucomicrobiota bacterium]
MIVVRLILLARLPLSFVASFLFPGGSLLMAQEATTTSDAVLSQNMPLDQWRSLSVDPSGRVRFEILLPSQGIVFPETVEEVVAWETLRAGKTTRAASLPLSLSAGRSILQATLPEKVDRLTIRLSYLAGRKVTHPNHITLSPGIPQTIPSTSTAGPPLSLQSSRTWESSIVWFHSSDANGVPLPIAEENQTNSWKRTTLNPPTLQVDPRMAQAPLRIWTEVESETDPGEPDDTRSHARSLSVGAKRPFRLYPSGDTDWFRFKLSKDATIQLLIASPAGRLSDLEKGLEVGIVDQEGNPYAHRISPLRNPFQWKPPALPLPSGTYDLWLRGREGSTAKSLLELHLISSTASPSVTPSRLSVEIVSSLPPLQAATPTLLSSGTRFPQWPIQAPLPGEALPPRSPLLAQQSSEGSSDQSTPIRAIPIPMDDPADQPPATDRLNFPRRDPSPPLPPRLPEKTSSSGTTKEAKEEPPPSDSLPPPQTNVFLWLVPMGIILLVLLSMLFFFTPRRSDSVIDLSG